MCWNITAVPSHCYSVYLKNIVTGERIWNSMFSPRSQYLLQTNALTRKWRAGAWEHVSAGSGAPYSYYQPNCSVHVMILTAESMKVKHERSNHQTCKLNTWIVTFPQCFIIKWEDIESDVNPSSSTWAAGLMTISLLYHVNLLSYLDTKWSTSQWFHNHHYDFNWTLHPGCKDFVLF